MSILNNSIVPASAGGYEIDNSLRFNDDDSAYLSWTPSSDGNLKTFTISIWAKKSNLDTYFQLFNGYVGDGNTVRDGLSINNGHEIEFLGYNGGVDARYKTSALYRDPSAWYHILVAVDTTQATASSRVRIYVNGSEVTDFSTETNPAQNYSFAGINNSDATHSIGDNRGSTFADGYMAEVNFIDGQALDPSDFGETGDYGEWKPIKYTGTYGTNGFYLDFENSGSLGNDANGSNNWTPNNLAATDQMLDSPTNNFATLNALDPSSNQTLSEGNLKQVTSGQGISKGTMQIPSSGKWYWEVCQTDTDQLVIGFAKPTATLSNYLGSDANGWGYGGYSGVIYNNGGSSAYGNTYTNGDIVGVAFDADNQAVYFSKNNTWQNSGDPTSGSSKTGAAVTSLTDEYSSASGSQDSSGVYNFGQDSSFAGNKTAQGNTDDNGYGDFYYEPPTGFNALCTQNLPDPAVTPSEHFNTVLYTGNGGTQSITGFGFQPDFVWDKSRNNTYSHMSYDAIRGVGKYLRTNLTNAEVDDASTLTSFDADGVTVGDINGNASGSSSVMWGWKANGSDVLNENGTIDSQVSANQAAGFSIVSWTGDGGVDTIGHGLSSAPEMIISKTRNIVNHWTIYHKDVGNDKRMIFTTATENTDSAWNNTTPTSSVFSVGTADTNGSGNDYIAYCFHSVEGYSKVGSYTGNGSTDGTFVYTGFRPAYVMTKATSISGEEWHLFDNKRATYNVIKARLIANGSTPENTNDNIIDFTSNGFKWRDSNPGYNSNGNTYIYLAFAENPFKHTNAR